MQAIVNFAVPGHMNWKMDFLDAVSKGVVPEVKRDHNGCFPGRSMAVLSLKLKKTPVNSS